MTKKQKKMIRRILIIDDEKIVRDELKRIFEVDELYNFVVETADSYKEAESILIKCEKRFDVVIIDWRFDPDESDGGKKILKELNKSLPKIKIVYTAYPTFDNCVFAMKSGANNYIDKNRPKSTKILLNAVKEELKKFTQDEHEPTSAWIAEHIEELQEKYTGELIAFINGKPVASSSKKKDLLEEVKKKYPNEKPFIMFKPMEVI